VSLPTLVFRRAAIVVFLIASIVVAACGAKTPTEPNLRVLSGSENASLEPLVTKFAQSQGKRIDVSYLGSVDIMRELGKGTTTEYDAVWPANSMWITLGDTNHVVKYQTSIMRSPVVFAVKRSVARSLGWIGRDVAVDDILQAAESGQLRFMMTSATQSNSGASAYLGFLYAFAGHPEVLGSADLNNPTVQAKVTRILGSVNRTAGSSGWLRDLFLERYDSYDAMVNYESLVIDRTYAVDV
jgi:Ca-activated chloride channel family protein